MKCAFIFFFGIQLLFSQGTTKDLQGTIKINDTAFIPFKISLFKNNFDEITGYSITDENGLHETKSYIKGSYNGQSGLLNFYEYDIVYSKSPYEELDFCFIHFQGEMKRFYSSKKVVGKFQGRYQDGSSCIDGEILLFDQKTVDNKLEKLEKKLEKPQYREKVLREIRKLDTIQLKPITTEEDLNVFVNSKTLMVSIYDSGKIDDDRIDLYVDEKLILKNYSIRKERKEIPIQIQKNRTSIKVVALNEGTSTPNTVKIEVQSDLDFITTKTTLKINESATLSLVKR